MSSIEGADPTQDEEEIDDDEDAAEMENNTDKSASKKSNEEVTSKAGKISLSIAIRYLCSEKRLTELFTLVWNGNLFAEKKEMLEGKPRSWTGYFGLSN